jgi:diguanylate cyclase (GGDEF)-like protein/PAS domain S-box-containing protein
MRERESRALSLDDPETLRRFVRNLGEGVYITTREGLILDANPAFLSTLGIASLEELRGKGASDLFVDPRAREQELEVLSTCGAVRDFEIEIRRPDGDTRWVVDTAYQVVDEDSGRIFYHGILVDITARKELEGRLHEAAIRDALTGCFNRHYLAELAERLERGDALWGVVVCDLDHFKEVNDRLGHKAGDDLLVHFARFLMCHSRALDAVVRLGGDEFLMLLVEAGTDVTETVTARLREAGPEAAPIAFSLGWATRRGSERLERTIARADKRLIAVRRRERGDSRRRGG